APPPPSLPSFPTRRSSDLLAPPLRRRLVPPRSVPRRRARPAPARRPSGCPGAGALGAAGDVRVLVGLVGVGAVDGRDHGARGGGRDGTGPADAPEDAVAELH